MDEFTLVLLYKSLIRPLLEYGQPIWYPYLLRQSRALEKIQRRATKLIPDLKHLPYKERLMRLNMQSLKYRRLRGDLIQVFKIITFSNEETISKFFTFSNSNNTRGHNLKLFKKSCRTDIRKHSFSNRVINVWNNLSVFTVYAPDINTFKKFLDGELFKLMYDFD